MKKRVVAYSTTADKSLPPVCLLHAVVAQRISGYAVSGARDSRHMAKENKVQYEASDRASEELLERFDRYIMIQVERLRRYYPTVIHSPVQDLEIDELVQR